VAAVSNGRKWKRRLAKDDVAFVLPDIPDDASHSVKDALAIRNAASRSGRCRCGAEMEDNGRDEAGIQHVVIRHESSCPAQIVNLLDLLIAERQRASR